MPTVEYAGETVDCADGSVIRDVLLDAGLTPHNDGATRLNCRGHGTCGTCAVAVSGPVSDPGRIESWRLDFPPHDGDASLRLACQTRVEGDVVVTKHPGFWGQHVDDAPVSRSPANRSD